jgi:hypothetical protein
MNFSILTDKQIIRLYYRIWARIENIYRGGLQFGLDMPTLRAVTPGWADLLVAIKTEGRLRRL